MNVNKKTVFSLPGGGGKGGSYQPGRPSVHAALLVTPVELYIPFESTVTSR